MDEDLQFMTSDPGRVRAKAYDIVCDGYEAGGGSIRIHRRDVQELMFRTLGLNMEEACSSLATCLKHLSTAPLLTAALHRASTGWSCFCGRGQHPRGYGLPQVAKRYRHHDRRAINNQ